MIVVRTENGNIFGGVMDLPFNFGTDWPDNPSGNNKKGYQRSTKSFLFGLNTPINGKTPTLWPCYKPEGAVAFTYGDGLFHLGGGNDFQLRKDGEFASGGRYYLNDRVRGGEMTGLVSSMAGADGGGGEVEVFTIEPKE